MSLFDWWWGWLTGKPSAPREEPTPPAAMHDSAAALIPPAEAAAHETRAAAPFLPVLSAADINRLVTRHRHFPDSVTWQLYPGGLVIDGSGKMERTAGEPATIRRIWRDYGDAILDAAERYAVPVEIIAAMIATESHGRPAARREEPGWTSDHATPHRVSIGLMQTLISTARAALQRPYLEPGDLLDPATSIAAGTAYIASQRRATGYDPPLVSAAYNAGSVRESARNRWRTVHTTGHTDNFVRWYGDACGLALVSPPPRHLSAALLIAGRP